MAQNNNGVPDEVLRSLARDPEFQKLDEAAQDRIISRFAQESYGKIDKHENVLQRASKAIQNAYSMNNPMQMANTMNPAFSGYNILHDFKSSGIKEAMPNHPIMAGAVDIATDPETYVGAVEAPKATGGLFQKAFPYTSKEARVGFTKGIEKSLINRRAALTRGFGMDLNKSKGIVDISNIVEPGSEITSLSMKEAQDLKNAITQGIPDAVKSGVRVDPKHFGSREIAGMITDAMKKADPSFAPTIEKYGQHAENFKSAIAPIKSAKGTENIFGSNLIKQMFGSGGSIPEKAQVALEEFAPNVAKKVHGAKVNENIFRGLRGATVGTAASKFVPGILKRALLAESTK